MKSRKILAATLVGIMAFSVAGCSMGGKGSKKYEKALKDLDYEEMEEYDEDDVLDMLEDGMYYSTKDEKEIKKMCKDDYLNGIKAKNVSSLFIGGKVEDGEMFVVYSVSFKDKDSAEKTFENFVEGLEEQEEEFTKYYKDSFKTDSDDDFFAVAFDDGFGQFEYYEIIMDDAKTMSIIVSIVSSDGDVFEEYQEFYEAIDRDCPSDMLKTEPGSKSSAKESAVAAIDIDD